MKWPAAQVALVVAGFGLLAYLVSRIGLAAIAAEIETLSWRLGVVLVFPFVVVTIFDTVGWRFTLRRDAVPFGVLYAARLAGEALNATTPTAMVGGEAMKAWLVRDHIGLDESVPSIVVAKTTITLAQGLFLGAGLACAWTVLHPGAPLLRAMEWTFGVEMLAIGGLVVAQVCGILNGGGRFLGHVGLPGAGRGVANLERALRNFYRREPGRVVLSTAAHFVGWALGALETYMVLAFLDVHVSLATAVVIESVDTAVRFVTFMVPGHVGALEGAGVASFVALGLAPSTGLSFVLVRRLREAVWTGLGYLALTTRRSVVPSAAPASNSAA